MNRESNDDWLYLPVYGDGDDPDDQAESFTCEDATEKW